MGGKSSIPWPNSNERSQDDDNYYSSEEMSRKRSSNNKENMQFISFELPSFPARRSSCETKSIDGVIISNIDEEESLPQGGNELVLFL